MASILLALSLLLSSNLTVLVTYFSPFGVERGVGFGALVVASDSSGNTSSCITNELSVCVVYGLSSPSLVTVKADVEDFNPWYYFKCEGLELIDDPEEYIHITCLREYPYPVWLPHLAAPTVKE